MHYSLDLNWDLFLNQVDLIHDDKPFFIPNFITSPEKLLSWDDVDNFFNFTEGPINIINTSTQHSENFDEIPYYYNKVLPNRNKEYQAIKNNSTFNGACYNNYNGYAKYLSHEIDKNLGVASDIQFLASLSSNTVSFHPHIDIDPIIVIQTYGKIEWTVYENKVTHLFPRGFINSVMLSKDFQYLGKSQTFSLTPGDLLYMPSRTPHQVKVNSTRLTLSIQCMPQMSNPKVDKSYYPIKSLIKNEIKN